MKFANNVSKKLVKSVITAEIKKSPRNCIGVIYQPARPKTNKAKNI